MWSQWIIFERFDTTTDCMQLKKQLHGLPVAEQEIQSSIKSVGMQNEGGAKKRRLDDDEFVSRSNANSSPGEQDVFEAIVRGIMKRKELGLYQNEVTLYSEL